MKAPCANAANRTSRTADFFDTQTWQFEVGIRQQCQTCLSKFATVHFAAMTVVLAGWMAVRAKG